MVQEVGDLPYSIETDASNIRHNKYFPISIRYYHPVHGNLKINVSSNSHSKYWMLKLRAPFLTWKILFTGIRTKLIALVNSSDETAEGMFNMLMTVLDKLKLPKKNISG